MSIAPSLLWLGSSNAALTVLLSVGVLSSTLLLGGLFSKLNAIVCWMCYLSLATAVPQFLNFQWDSLLLETGLLGILFSPWKVWESPKSETAYSPLVRWLIGWLLFRLMFESGYVKLNSFGANNENTWWDLTALNFHYFTQPIPHGMSWHFHHMPNWFHQTSLCVMFAIELMIPFLIFTPRPVRTVALLSQMVLQLLIMSSGNFGFFNLLTCLLCVPLFADQSFPPWLRKFILQPNAEDEEKGADDRGQPSIATWMTWSNRMLLWPSAGIIIFISSLELFAACKWIDLHERDAALTGWLQAFRKAIAPYRSINGYGLFRVMTTERPEIIIAGSDDGIVWEPYIFKWKPVQLNNMPGCAIPHMPRLDWQMWFAALRYRGQGQFQHWFERFINELKQNNATVTALLEHNPFQQQAPQYIRIQLYLYTYTSPDVYKQTGQFWERELLPQYTLIVK